MKTPIFLWLGLILPVFALPLATWAGQKDIVGPAGSDEFGQAVTALPNGNLVVIDTEFDGPGPTSNVGAVHLYSPDGELISTLRGSTAGDRVGWGGIRVLSNGHYVVSSPFWHNGAAAQAGATTWCNGATGVNGVVSETNSLVGTSEDDASSVGVTALSNGNYVVNMPNWDNGGATDAGAATWINGATGLPVGPVSATNSLLGTTAEDFVGSWIVPLSNGNYVVDSGNWSNGATAFVGAVTWVDGTNGFPNGASSAGAAVSVANSLVGTTAEDYVGGNIFPLSNGNYVVCSSDWHNGPIAEAGAATWVNGATGLPVGGVDATNSLVGSSSGDGVGGQFTMLTNGNYVVGTYSWDNNGVTDAGAATWVNGSNGHPAGETSPGATVSIANSLVGTSATDQVSTVVPLTNGNYVVRSTSWSNGSVENVGAVTWGSGTTGVKGEVSAANSLVGSSTLDLVGSNVTALSNGNYVVGSPNWDNNGVADAGAATWCDGTIGGSGLVSSGNSLVGTHEGDQVGLGIIPLTNGNYVVASSSWTNGALESAGAVIWVDGANGFPSGAASPGAAVSTANSLVGATAEDFVGNDVVALSNGNYVVISPNWHSGAVAAAGAVTWGNGATGTVGAVAAANSLVGGTTGDRVGGGSVVALSDGNYVVASPEWNNGALADAGAVTWCNGTTGTTGPISAANSLVGSAANDQLGYDGVTPFADGNYAVLSPYWNNGAILEAGAMTLVLGNSPPAGPVNGSNSVLGGVAGGQLSFAYDAALTHLIVGRRAENMVSIFTRQETLAFDAALFTVNESGGTADVTITRTGSTFGSVTARLSTINGTAAAPGDFIAKDNELVTLGDGVSTKDVSITLKADGGEPNEAFTVTLGSPGGGAALDAPIAATVRIVDSASDDTKPLVTISTPSSGLMVPESAGTAITVTGKATDKKGVSNVQVKFNDGAFTDAVIPTGTLGAPSTTYSFNGTLIDGPNTIQARSFDYAGNISDVVSRSVTFVKNRNLTVEIAPLNSGKVTAGFFGTTVRLVGRSYTLTATGATTPAPGFTFDHWGVSGGPTLGDIGVTAGALLNPQLTFTFREGLVLTANFVANPFVTPAIPLTGVYNGLVTASLGTTPSNSTEGFFTATVMSTGAFSGKLTLDGLVLPVAGTFDSSGDARFGPNGDTSVTVARTGKPSLVVALHLDLSAPGADYRITGPVKQFYRATLVAESEVAAHRAFYDGKTIATIVPPDYLALDNAKGVFTLVLPATPLASQPDAFKNSGATEADFPQGDGIARLTLTKSGVVKLAGTLADATPVSVSTTLCKEKTWQFFIPLYNKLGFIRGTVTLDHLNATSDMSATDVLWSRPFMNVPHYRFGWPETIHVGMMGAKFVVATGQSVLKAPDDFAAVDGGDLGDPLPSPDEDGNALLELTDGKLNPDLVGALGKDVNISTGDGVTKIPGTDTSFTLTITRSTGIISGTFTHSDGTKPAFKAISYQKGTGAGGRGFFRTATAASIDGNGESGAVTLKAQ